VRAKNYIFLLIISLMSSASYGAGSPSRWEHNEQGTVYVGYQAANFPERLTNSSHTMYRNLMSEDYYLKTEHTSNLYKNNAIFFFVLTTHFCMDNTIRVNGVKVSVYATKYNDKCYIDVKTLKGTAFVLEQIQKTKAISIELSNSRKVSFSTNYHSNAVHKAKNYVQIQNDYKNESDAL